MYQRRPLCLLLSLLFAGSVALAQCKTDVLMWVDPNGNGSLLPAIGASVRVCQPGATGYPCTPLSTLYTDQTLATVQPLNPISTDSFGNYTFCTIGTTVYLESTFRGTVKVQPTYVIAPGSSGGPGGGIQSINQMTNQNQTITGSGAATVTFGGGNTNIFVPTGNQSGPVLAGLSLSASAVLGGGTVTGTVTLSSAAPTGGVTVTLTSSNPTAAVVPATVTVLGNATTANFTVGTNAVTSDTPVTITGLLLVTQTASLDVQAPPPPPQPIYGGVGTPGANANVTLSGNTVVLSTGDVLNQLQTTPEQVFQSWPMNPDTPNGQAIYFLFFGGSHTSWFDVLSGFTFVMNAPIQVNLNGVTMFLYQSSFPLIGQYQPQIRN